MAIFSGTAHPRLAAAIGHHLGVPVSPARLTRFANDCLEVQLQANCRERDVYLVQPIVPPTQEHLVELLLMIDAARGASAGRITVVMPHYAYARSDKKDAPRISIGARLVADLIAAAGANRVLTMTLHSPQVHGFFSIPVDHLHALHELAGHFRAGELSNAIVMSPDLGNAKTATAFSRMLGVPVAAAAKQRVADDKVMISSIIGDVRGRDVIVLDDEIARGSTILELLDHLAAEDVASVRVACTHGLFTEHAIERIQQRAEVAEIVCTNTVPVPDEHAASKLTVLSVAPALAEAMRRIHNGESVSVLFDAPPV
jgi:ribose-phosphate pyrophosphokinase